MQLSVESSEKQKKKIVTISNTSSYLAVEYHMLFVRMINEYLEKPLQHNCHLISSLYINILLIYSCSASL